MTVRWIGKRLIERALRLLPLTPRRMRGRSLILAYHNVVPDGLQGWGDCSLHLPFTEFVRQVDLLQEHCRLAGLSEVLEGASSTERPVVALTFDDAYRGAVELALPELARRGIPSTLFVAPGLLGRRRLWWDALARGRAGLPATVREEVLMQRQGRQDWQAEDGPPLVELPEYYECADEEAILALRRFETTTLAAHTWSHPNLTRISRAELAEEMSRPLDWLRSFDGPTVPMLAYPYGLASPTVQAAAKYAGYSAGFMAAGGWYSQATGSWMVSRYNVPAGLSADGFVLRLSGLVRLSPRAARAS